MAILKKTLFAENLEKFNVLVQDTEPDSRYFKITELPDVFTGGKNGFLIQGSAELVSDTIIKIEIKDALGNVIYHEPGEGIPEYYEGTSKVVAVYIYPDTAFGPCIITILGELKEYIDSNGLLTPVPINWEGQYNVKWQKQINVNPALPNTSKIRFYRRPKIDITESILPVYNRTVFSRTISGSINATPINPISGSDYRLFKGILQYELSATASVFSQSMEGETITISGLGGSYTPTITDVTTDKKAFVNVPYYVTSSLAPNYYAIAGFTDKQFTLTFDESENLSNSNVSSSFATIKLTDLESFTGDPARIKVYASSRQDLGDYQLLEDIQIESTEVFLARQFENQLNVRTGVFTTSIIDNFWRTENLTTTVTATLDNSALLKSVKLLPATDVSSSVGLFKFYNSGSIDFSKNTEYALDFTPLLVSASFYGRIEVYGSGSAFTNTNSSNDYGKLIGYLEAPSLFKKYDKQQFNFKSDNDGVGNISFVVKGGVWQLANISLRAAHESAFAPNEVTLIADVPTKINNETFDFRFEIYDLNNNYVPVLLEKTFTFTGGNDIRIKRDLTVTPAFNQFNFSTSSVFPASILIDYTTTGLTGSITFYSQAVDTTGLGITNADVTIGSNYPGFLNYVDIDTRELTVANFTSSLEGGKKVGAITYTASVENINRYFTIYRSEQGAPAYLFYATADKNNFTFDPDDNYKSVVSDDYIDIRLVKQNLPSLSPIGLQIYSGSESYEPPPLTTIGSIGNATIYRLYATSSTHPSSVDGYYYNLGQSHYDFELSTVDGLFTSSVIIDAISKGDKGKGIFASADRNQFFYKMTDLTPYPGAQTSTILVKRQNLGSQTNTITVTKTGSGPDLTLSNNNVGNGVAQYTVNTTNYTYASGETKYTFSATDLNGTTYTDEITLAALIAEAQISVNLTNENASLPALSTGVVPAGSFVLSSGSVSVKVAGEDITRQEGLATNNRFDIISATGTGCTPNDTTPDDAKYSITALSQDSGSLSLVVRYKDGRGSTSDVTKIVSYSKNKKAAPVISISSTPNKQSVSAKSTGAQIDSFSNANVTVSEIYNGSTTTKTITSLTATSDDIPSIVTNAGTGLITLAGRTLADGTNATTVTVTAVITDSENTSRTVTDTLSLSKVKKAAPVVVAIFSKESQSVTKTNAGAYGSPTTFTIVVNEGAGNYTYSTGGAVSTYYVSAITGGSNSNGTITPTAISSDAGATISITISYVNSEGTAGTITKEHKINVTINGNDGATGATGAAGANGNTGPGVVFTGPWEAGRTYQFTSGSVPGRRDIVIWSSTGTMPYDTYYGNKRLHLSAAGNVANGAPNQGSSTAWEELGTQDFFVAAKIGLFEESYVQNTLNIGTNNNGGLSSANITLAGGSANPYISIGQSGIAGSQGYDVDGIFLGFASSVAKFSIKNGADNYIRWNGTNLELSGTVNATGGTFSGNITVAGSITGGDIVGATLTGATGNFSGSIASKAGNIAGWTIADTQIYDDANKLKLNSARPAIEIYDANGLAVDISSNASLSLREIGTVTLSSTTYTTTNTQTHTADGGQYQTVISANMNPGIIYSTGGSVPNFTYGSPNATYAASITLSGATHLLVNAEVYRSAGGLVIVNVAASYTVGVSVRTGNVNGTEIATLSAYKNAGQSFGTSIITLTSNPTITLTGNLDLVNGTTYYLVPFITLGQVSIFRNSGTADYFRANNVVYRTPAISAISISKGISKTELVAGGFQVVASTDRYCVIERNQANADFVSIGGGLTCTGDVTANTSSDINLKGNIKLIENPIEKIKKISGNTFEWKTGYEEYHSNTGVDYGVIAQEIEDIMPEIVIQRDSGFKGVRYEKIIPLLIEAIKEQQNQIDELKNK